MLRPVGAAVGSLVGADAPTPAPRVGGETVGVVEVVSAPGAAFAPDDDDVLELLLPLHAAYDMLQRAWGAAPVIC